MLVSVPQLEMNQRCITTSSPVPNVVRESTQVLASLTLLGSLMQQGLGSSHAPAGSPALQPHDATELHAAERSRSDQECKLKELAYIYLASSEIQRVTPKGMRHSFLSAYLFIYLALKIQQGRPANTPGALSTAHACSFQWTNTLSCPTASTRLSTTGPVSQNTQNSTSEYARSVLASPW
jgi:hypothetical protein